MSEKDPIRIFVAHAFQEHEEYARVFEYLEARDKFYYVNYSDPDGKPEVGGQEGLQEAIRKQIRMVEVVLFPVGVYIQDPRIIEFELKVAQAFDKPVIAIQAFGLTQTLPREIAAAAAETVEWNDRAITDAIRHFARGEDTAKWDVVEFDPDLLG
jgi:hypothetical protein